MKPVSPWLEFDPHRLPEGLICYVRGYAFPDGPLTLRIDEKDVRPMRVLKGHPLGLKFRPEGDGEFIVALSTRGLKSGRRKVDVRGEPAGDPAAKGAAAVLQVLSNPALDPAGRLKRGVKMDRPALRVEQFFRRRFGHLGFVPDGFREVQLGAVRGLRPGGPPEGAAGGPPGGPGPDLPSPPVPGSCNWTPIGPACIPDGQTDGGGQVVSGRILCIAIDSVTPDNMLIGTAGGGIWKSTDAGVTWTPKTDYAMSMAIGALAINPANPAQVLAGSGEYHDNTVGGLTYYGNGLLRSTNGGDNWSEISGGIFTRNEVSAIAYDPTDPLHQRVYVATTTGIYESPDGVTWGGAPIRVGSASGLVALENPVTPGSVRLVAAFYGSGIWVGVPSAGTWAWTQSTFTPFTSGVMWPGSYMARIGLWQSGGNPQVIMVLFSSNPILIGQSTNGGTSWSRITVRLDTEVQGKAYGAGAPAHEHDLTIPAADVIAAPAAHTYTTTSAGSPAHTHTVSLTAQQTEIIAAGGLLIKDTDPDATGHQHPAWVFGRLFALQYNLVIAVHPMDNNLIYLGDTRLWRCATGGGTFTNITDGEGPHPPGEPFGIHADQHAFAFDPDNPDIVWIGNDGGLYRSPDTGNNWSHRNRDLATLQYMHLSQHPVYETVLLGGTQDNGTHRYSGHPAWRFVAGGDGGFTAINQSNPLVMYHGYIYNTFYRSDNAGVSWLPKTSGIDTSLDCEFYPPFELDPTDQSVCYFGNHQLWRSADNADNWGVIMDSLPADVNFTAMAVDPGAPDVVYAGTSSGVIYRVQRTGATWTLADITTTTISDGTLPGGTYISDLAVDSAGTLWVTYSAVTWTEFTGEFSNAHVFRLVAGGAGWESRNTGLAMANPVNSIVIDPDDDEHLFIGTDLGVFRTETGGSLWTLWDDGLPNVPIFHLVIHQPMRLLRAATHGRGAWERPIDIAACPLVDLYVRDNIVDSGRRQPSPDFQPHPFEPGVTVYHWQSEDIKVDALEGMPPAFQTPAAVENYVFFESRLQHRNPKRGETNRFYVQVHNRGVNPATNVRVRAFFADAHAGLPPLPPDFWTSGRPFTGTPGGTDWTAIAPTHTFPTLEACEPGVKVWTWPVPLAANDHSCLLIVTSCDEDPIAAAGMFDVDTLVVQKKHVALKNLQVIDLPPAAPASPASPASPETSSMIGMYGDERQPATDFVMHWGTLPKGTRLFFAFEFHEGVSLGAQAAKGIEGQGIAPLRNAAKVLMRERPGRGTKHRFDLGSALVAEHNGQRAESAVRGLRLPAKRSTRVVFNLELPKSAAPGKSYRFDILQRSLNAVGGSSYLVRVGKKQGR